jgi:hypothetical protein
MAPCAVATPARNPLAWEYGQHVWMGSDGRTKTVPFSVKNPCHRGSNIYIVVRELLDGDLGAHRDLPVDTEDQPERPAPVSLLAPRAVYREQKGDLRRRGSTPIFRI